MIVLTGAAGFIGSCLLAKLNAIGRQDLIIVDHLNDAQKKENLKDKKYTEYYDKKDFLEIVTNDKLDKSVDLVIHMGACSSTILQDAQYFEENNFQYSCRLAEWCLKHRARLIYASSAATYGDGAQGYRDDHARTHLLKPLNLYGLSKQKFDLWVLDHSAMNQCVGLKFFNVFGPNEYHKGEMRSVIAKVYDRVKREGKINLFKSYQSGYRHGEQKRDFIYIKDAVNIVMFFYHHSDIHGIFNAGTGQSRTWNELAGALFAAVGRKPCIEYTEMPDYLKEKYQYFTEADMSKLRKAGYQKNFMSLEDSVKDYAAYLDQHAYI